MDQEARAETSANDFLFSIPGRGATNYVISVGVGSVIFLLFYGCYDILRDIFSYSLKDPTPSQNEFIFMLSMKTIFYIIFPLLALLGIILTLLLRSKPFLINRYCCQPVFLLIPTIFPLGYQWIMSLFQMINSLTVLADEIFDGNSWAYVIISTIKFLALLFLLSWYYVLIQVAFGQYKIAKETNSNSASTTTPGTAAQIQPLQPPSQPNPNQSINIENENNLSDSSETPLSPFNI